MTARAAHPLSPISVRMAVVGALVLPAMGLIPSIATLRASFASIRPQALVGRIAKQSFSADAGRRRTQNTQIIPAALAVDVTARAASPVTTGLDPPISLGCSLTRIASFARWVRVRMAGSSLAMTRLDSRCATTRRQGVGQSHPGRCVYSFGKPRLAIKPRRVICVLCVHRLPASALRFLLGLLRHEAGNSRRTVCDHDPPEPRQ